jgi:hypothetical protein
MTSASWSSRPNSPKYEVGTIGPGPQIANRLFVRRDCALALIEDTLQRPDVLPVIRGGHGEGFADDLPDILPDIRSGCPLMSGARNPAVSADFPRLCQGDKHPDNTVIAGLARPAFTADKPLG